MIRDRMAQSTATARRAHSYRTVVKSTTSSAIDDCEIAPRPGTLFSCTRPPPTLVLTMAVPTPTSGPSPERLEPFRNSAMVPEPRVLALASAAEQRTAGGHSLRTLAHCTRRPRLARRNRPTSTSRAVRHAQSWRTLLRILQRTRRAVRSTPGSHKLDWVRLLSEYDDQRGEHRRSRRIGADEVRVEVSRRERSPVAEHGWCFAHTCGYHVVPRAHPGPTRKAAHDVSVPTRFGSSTSSASTSAGERWMMLFGCAARLRGMLCPAAAQTESAYYVTSTLLQILRYPTPCGNPPAAGQRAVLAHVRPAVIARTVGVPVAGDKQRKPVVRRRYTMVGGDGRAIVDSKRSVALPSRSRTP